jgi:benzodiazapine receptor
MKKNNIIINMVLNQLKILGISFSHFLFSLPFTLSGLSNLGNDKYKADWQPPGYVFAIVWPILYLLFGIMNLKTYYSSQLSLGLKNKILSESFSESIYQAIWLLVSSNITGVKYKFQYILSFIVIIYIASYGFFTRKNTLLNADKTLYLMYIPYLIWISFASILSYQIFRKVIA